MIENRPRIRRHSAALVMFCAVAAPRLAGAGEAADAGPGPRPVSGPSEDARSVERKTARVQKGTAARTERAARDGARGATSDAREAAEGTPARGLASFYSHELSGRRTASGERYDPAALTAAHRNLPMGTQLRVVNAQNDRSVVVTVNDRGPVTKNRLIDLSAAAAHELGMKAAGVTRVDAHVVGRPADAGDEARASIARNGRGAERNGPVASAGAAGTASLDDRH